MSNLNVTSVEENEDFDTPTVDSDYDYILIKYKGTDETGKVSMDLEIKGFAGDNGYELIKDLLSAIYRGM